MSDTLSRKHWYDGWFYALFIDSDHSVFRDKLFGIIDHDKTVIDVGCGTGRFALKMAERNRYVLGIDVSEKQIRVAQKRKLKRDLRNIEFKQINALNLVQTIKQKFDYATLSFVLHEIAHEDRIKLLNEVKKVARTVVILDYYIPHPYNIWGIATRLIEFFAGRDHFKNFRDFSRHGGLDPLLQYCNLKIKQEEINQMKIFRIIAASCK